MHFLKHNIAAQCRVLVGSCMRPWIYSIHPSQQKTNKRDLSHLHIRTAYCQIDLEREKWEKKVFLFDSPLIPSQGYIFLNKQQYFPIWKVCLKKKKKKRVLMLKRVLTENLKRWWARISKTAQNTGLNCRGQMPQTSLVHVSVRKR